MTAILTTEIVEGIVAATPAISEDNPPAVIASQRVEFVETAGAGTYTAEVTVPAGWYVAGHVLRMTGFDADSTIIDGGDTGDPNRFFNNLNFDIASADTLTKVFDSGRGSYADNGDDALGKDAEPYDPYYPAGDTLTYTVTTTGAGGTTGRLTIIVNLVQLPATAITATKGA